MTLDPNWVVAVSTVVYTGITAWLIFEQRRSRVEDKFPCIVVRARLNPSRVTALGVTTDEWKLRLVNVGRGPAFIEHFETAGLPHYVDGVHTDAIDKVVGPDVGDPDLQVDFADGTPDDLRRPGVRILVKYRDIAGNLFESILIGGKPSYKRL